MMKNTPESIFQVASGFMASKHLFVVNELGLFAYLATGPSTLDELAQRIGIPHRTLRILTDAMVALGFVEREADRYQNGPVAATFLSGQMPADLRPFLRFWNEIVYPAWMQLEEAMRTGQVAVGQLNEPDEQRKRMISEGVEALTAGSALALASNYDFGPNQRLLDLGGHRVLSACRIARLWRTAGDPLRGIDGGRSRTPTVGPDSCCRAGVGGGRRLFPGSHSRGARCGSDRECDPSFIAGAYAGVAPAHP